jgi:erythromycin esterase
VCLICALMALSTTAFPDQRASKGASAREEPTSLIAWARRSMTPINGPLASSAPASFDALGAMIGDASVVALGEGVHFAAEPLEFRNRLLQYLVQSKGFTAIAIESGLIEGRGVDDYVSGGGGELSSVLREGVGWTFDQLPQNAALVRWMRDYNADASHPRKIHFYGFDISGSPGNSRAHRGADTALVAALAFLERVDPVAARSWRVRLEPVLPYVRYDFVRAPGQLGYEELGPTRRDLLTSAIDDLIRRVETHRGAYVAASSADDYAWGYRAAIAARQVDQWLRELPVGVGPLADPVAALAEADERRDRAQADNIGWIRDREGPDGKLLIFAHTVHLSRSTVLRRWGRLGGNPQAHSGATDSQRRYRVAGTYLDTRRGTGLIVMGGLIGHGVVGCGALTERLTPPAPDTLAGMVGRISAQDFALDLRGTPPEAMGALTVRRALGHNDELFGFWEDFAVPARPAFDVLIYFDAVTPACHP